MGSTIGGGGLARAKAAVLFGIALAHLMCAVPASAENPARATTLHVATFDSGFGGFLTAKSIEATSASLLRDYNAEITIRHYGDTQNLPYGEKSPDQIARLASAGVLKAFSEGADMVFIACNTASTQFLRIREAVDATYPGANLPVVSIIDVSVSEARRRLDEILKSLPRASLVVMATPATVRSMTYPRRLAALYGASITEEPPLSFRQPRWYRTLGASVESLTQISIITLPDGRRIEVYQLAPANWVELIEHGADTPTRRRAVHRDLGLMIAMLPANTAPDVVGYFCTHFPLLDGVIRADLASRLPHATVNAWPPSAVISNPSRGRTWKQTARKLYSRFSPPASVTATCTFATAATTWGEGSFCRSRIAGCRSLTSPAMSRPDGY